MKEQMRGKYLPVGSVVLLKNGTKRVMVNGFCVIDSDKPEKVYDYSAVLFPEGNISSTQTLLFDHEQIERIDHIGLDDEEEKAFKTKLNEIISAPAAPTAPVAPEAPVAPVAPAPMETTPVTPVAPVAPVAPVMPETPVAPIAPAQPVAPVAPVDIAPAQPIGNDINPQ